MRTLLRVLRPPSVGLLLGVGILLVGSVLVSSVASAGEPETANQVREPAQGSATAVLHEFAEGVREFNLKNGLRVLYYRRGYAPVFLSLIHI